ncbi:MAG: type II toxin-antitoxin system VapC family toxin [bacterium]
MTNENLVLDAWTILAYLQDHSVTVEHLDRYLEEASHGSRKLKMSWINGGEVEYIIRHRHGKEEAREILELIQFLPIALVEATPDRVHQAASVKAEGGLSYADAFAVALAGEYDAQIITGDPEIIQHCPAEQVVNLTK